MCIVAIKPQGVHRPSDEMFTSMCSRNSDGFGMVTWSQETGLVVKKTMSVNEYMQWVHEVDDATPAIFHMRIATHGSIGTRNCHPFLSKKKDWAFAHNGILTIDNEKDMTDSETFFRRIALPFIRAGHTPHTQTFDSMVATIIGSSKFAFMDSRGTIYTYGNYIKHPSGLMFSNSSYESYSYPTMTNVGNYCCTSQSFGKPLDDEEDSLQCYSALCDAFFYDKAYVEGMTDAELYDEYGRSYNLSRETFREVLQTVREVIAEDEAYEEEDYLKQYAIEQ